MKSKLPPDHLLPSFADCNQSRETGMPLKKSQFDQIKEIDPFTKMESNPATSEKQARFMRGCEHSPGSMSKPCPSKSVAKEFNHTD